jgi:membrane associated rhomboid family serine protease
MRFIALWLCAACILMFVAQHVVGTEPFVLDRSLMWSEPWRLVTSIFAHEDIGHLLANLFGLALFGLVLEGRIGPKRVFWLFMLSGIAINVFSPYPRSLGASGAIYAILGALIVLRPWMQIWVSYLPMPMFIAGIVWLAQDVIGSLVPDTIGHLAHLGGLGIGVAMGFVWKKRFGDPPRRKNKYDPKLERELDRWEDTYMRT